MRKTLKIINKFLNKIRTNHPIMLIIKIVSLKLNKRHLLSHRRNNQKQLNKIRALLGLDHLILNCLLLSMSQKLKFSIPSIPTLPNLSHNHNHNNSHNHNPSLNHSHNHSLSLSLKTNHPKSSLDHSPNPKLIILNQGHKNLLLNLLKEPKFLKKLNHNHRTKTIMI